MTNEAGEMPEGWEPKLEATNVRPTDPRHDDIRPVAMPVQMTTDETWEKRHLLSDPQLQDAAGNCLTIAAQTITDGVISPDAGFLYMLRAQWYMLRLEGRQRAFREGIISVLGGDQFSMSAGPSRWAQDYRAGSQLYPKAPKLNELRCSDTDYHGEHTWTSSDDDPQPIQAYTCPGRYRPIKDNPQA